MEGRGLAARLSIKGILIGGITDIVSSVIAGIPFAVFTAISLHQRNVPPEQWQSSMANGLGTHLDEIVGLLCSMLGGYVAARIAKHDELLNGTLSSLLCLALGAFMLLSGKDHQPLWIQLGSFIAAPAFACFGGYLCLRSKRS